MIWATCQQPCRNPLRISSWIKEGEAVQPTKENRQEILSEKGKSSHQQEEGNEDEETERQEKNKVLEYVIHTEQ